MHRGGNSRDGWHGNVAANQKHDLLKQPSGILRITPEALEGLLLNRSADLTRFFGEVRWVVIDEVHAFMESDRGGQCSPYSTDSRVTHSIGRSSAAHGTLRDAGELRRGVGLAKWNHGPRRAGDCRRE